MDSCAAAGSASAANRTSAVNRKAMVGAPPLKGTCMITDTSAGLFPGLEFGFRLGIGGIQAEDAAPLLDAVFHPVLELSLCLGFLPPFFGELRRDHPHAFGIADEHVRRIHGHAAAADRHLHVDGVMAHEVERRRASR